MRIGITREENQLAELKPLADQKGIELLPVPVIKIKPLKFEYSFENNPDWILFTSANAVSIFFQHLKRNNHTLTPQTKIASIGKKTSNRIKSFGYKVNFEATDSYGETFFNEFAEQIETEPLKIIFIRGEKVNFDPSHLFEKHNFQSIICYRTIEVDVDKSQIDKLTKDDCLLFTAPSAVKSYHRQFSSPISKIYAIGKTTAAEMKKLGWTGLDILNDTDIKNILELV